MAGFPPVNWLECAGELSDDSCIRATDAKYIDKKQKILDFVETTDNKYEIARLYAALCEGKRIDHPLAELIGTQLGLEKR
jgi:hypothetical protein